MSLRPLGNNVIIRPEDVKDQTAFGLYLPEQAKEKPQVGAVVAVGTGEKIEFTVGDSVVYNRYAGTEVKDGDETLLLVNVDHVYAVIQ